MTLPAEVEARITEHVARAYRRTHERLADDPTYLRLRVASEAEEAAGADTYIDRNAFALYIESHTPLEFL